MSTIVLAVLLVGSWVYFLFTARIEARERRTLYNAVIARSPGEFAVLEHVADAPRRSATPRDPDEDALIEGLN